jgi:hypothetical protein
MVWQNLDLPEQEQVPGHVVACGMQLQLFSTPKQSLEV